MRTSRDAFPSVLRPLAALAVGAAAIESLLSAATPNEPWRERLIAAVAPQAVPSFAHLLVLLSSLLLLVLAPSLWRGTRRAWTLSIALLLVLAVLNLIKGLDFEESALDLALVVLLGVGARAFVLGAIPRPRLLAGIAAVGTWASVYIVLLAQQLLSDSTASVSHDLRASVAVGTHASAIDRGAGALVELLIVAGLLSSLWFVRSALRPASGSDGHTESEHAQAKDLVRRFGLDSLAPFILREDKALHFHRGAVLAYRVMGDTAVVSGDPIGPAGSAAPALASFIELARCSGWHVVLAGASQRHLADYFALGLRHLHIGNEAVVDPGGLSLEGRAMRKVRQSVNRVARRGWSIEATLARDIAGGLSAEMGELERVWQAQQRRIIGFAMSMGACEADRAPDDLYVLARDPQGALRGLLRFAAYRGGLSLDSMRRIGECPNGLNEALVVRALEVARERGVDEVSLNFAGFAHLMAAEAAELAAHRRLARFLLGLLGEHFQMERLVRFNEKFAPQWRPRFLIYESRARLPRVGLRVLQAEAYLPGPRSAPLQRRWQPARPQASAGAG
ncbi:MAG: bifunctional lysylphosphatidylglycerol flippase/synthetase MprF [Solirubrobacteraceae bacterium]